MMKMNIRYKYNDKPGNEYTDTDKQQVTSTMKIKPQIKINIEMNINLARIILNY